MSIGSSEWESDESEFTDSDAISLSSNDSTEGYTHWSKTQKIFNKIKLKNNIPEFGKPNPNLDKNLSYTQLVEKVLDEQEFNIMIDATNEHGKNDKNYMKLSKDRKGRAYIKGKLSKQSYRTRRNITNKDYYSTSYGRGAEKE